MSEFFHAYKGAEIYEDGQLLREKMLLLRRDGSWQAGPIASVECPVSDLDGGYIIPGFIDLQVNGGGGVLLNDAPSVETLAQVATAHEASGTIGLLPTLITDTPEKVTASINAVQQAIKEGVAGILGLHLEGPHLSVRRKGAHDGSLIRRMEERDLEQLLEATERLPNLMVTVAPEAVTAKQIAMLNEAGAIVSLGHSDASYEMCCDAFDAGARCVTHLFNAMSPLSHRAPGLVGAALERSEVFAGLIADGIHVHPAAMKIALRSKPENLFLVTDSMAVAGTDLHSFKLGSREVRRKNGCLNLPDGTLAGADLSFQQALRTLTQSCGISPQEAISQAIDIPKRLLRTPGVQSQKRFHIDEEFSCVTELKDPEDVRL